MKNKGFTLIELLAVITLLIAVMLLIYPAVLERVKDKENGILEKKKELIYNAAYDYLYENKATYPIRSGNIYCVNMGHLGSLNRLPIDDYEDLLKNKADLAKNYIIVKIGNEDNAYSISTDTSACKAENIIGG